MSNEDIVKTVCEVVKEKLPNFKAIVTVAERTAQVTAQAKDEDFDAQIDYVLKTLDDNKYDYNSLARAAFGIFAKKLKERMRIINS